MSIEGIHRSYIGDSDIRSAQVTTYLEEHYGLEDNIVAKVMQIQKTLYIEKSLIESQEWIDRVKKGDCDATAALLVTLFPNVKSLRMPTRHGLGPDTLLIHWRD